MLSRFGLYCHWPFFANFSFCPFFPFLNISNDANYFTNVLLWTIFAIFGNVWPIVADFGFYHFVTFTVFVLLVLPDILSICHICSHCHLCLCCHFLIFDHFSLFLLFVHFVIIVPVDFLTHFCLSLAISVNFAFLQDFLAYILMTK